MRLTDIKTLEVLVGASENDHGMSTYVKELRASKHGELSLDEARIIAERLYWAIECLASNAARSKVVENAVRVTQS